MDFTCPAHLSDAHILVAFSSLTTLPAFGLVLPVALSNAQFGQLLDARTAFAVLTLFHLVSAGIQDGAAQGMQIMVALGSLERVQSSLISQRVWKDGRRHVGHGRHESTDTISAGSKLSTSSTVVQTHDRESVDNNNLTDTKYAVTLDKVTTQWGDENDDMAKEISFRIPRDGLTVLYGPTGSGKSTLLKLITGENAPVSGKVSTVDRHIALCDQPPWIANLSIKDNIVGALPFDEKLYQTVLDTCALDRDIGELAEGEQHICGLNGGTISGGQKARIVCCDNQMTFVLSFFCADSSGAGFGTDNILESKSCGPRRLFRGIRSTYREPCARQAFRT